MIQTLSGVMESRDSLLEKFNRVNEDMGRDSMFNSSQMDGVVVLPDVVAKGFLLANYSFNTHFVPGCLPASGEIIGDFLKHQGKTHLTLHYGTMMANLMLFHLVRGIEPIYKDWYEHADELSQEVEIFIEQVRAEEVKVLESIESADIIKRILDKHGEWRDTYVGWNYLGTPSPQFINILSEIGNKCNGLIAKGALDLENKLRPYCDLPETLGGFRNQIRHKGIPIIKAGMISTTQPAASGGASIHTHVTGDDVGNALPSSKDMFIIAAQAGAIGVMHIGGGNVTGEHIILIPPRTPFFDMVQEAVDDSSELKDLWQEIKDKTRDEFLEKAVSSWVNTTREIKEQAIARVVPDIISSRVLGFHVDLKSERRVAQLHPIVSECAIPANKEMLKKYKWEILTRDVDSVLLEAQEGYFALSPIC